MNKLFTIKKAGVLCAMLFSSLGIMAQSYTYRTESFEDAAWETKGGTVTSATGLWTTNNNVRNSTYAQEGTYSLLLSNKNGLTSPELPEGAGTLVYYAYDSNRQVYVETSSDMTTWNEVEAYKETSAWTKHSVTINDATVKYVRIRTTSNNNFYIDNIIITKLDGTDGDGTQVVSNLSIPYFVQTFEDATTYPGSKEEAATEKAYNVPGQGEWRYLNAYKSTNEAYITDGSTRALRMLKGISHVISPVVSQGVVKLSFNEGRTGKKLVVYTSVDGGSTWTRFKEVVTDELNVLSIDDKNVNRVKIANEGTGGDVDVDNICLTAFPVGTPGTAVTGDVSNITSSSADVKGSVTDAGDKEPIEWGVCWSLSDAPSINDNKVKASASDFSVTLSNLTAASTVYYRAYVLSLAGVGYGDVKQFTTADATIASLVTADVVENADASDEQYIYVNAGGMITDNGGLAPTEVGVCYGTSENPDVNGDKVRANAAATTFTALIPLLPETKYYFRAYSTSAAGTGYGDCKTFTTGKIEIPEYAHNKYYCDPAGNDATADGSQEKPFYSVQKAIDLAQPGDFIYMNAGTYNYATRINVPNVGKKNSGMISLHAVGGRAVLDFSSMAVADANQGMRITGSYWHVYGIDICNAGDNGMLIERDKPSGGGYEDCKNNVTQGHDNVIENCRFYRNADTGLQMKNLASGNKVINCDAFFNVDPSEGNADGFAVKISHGDGNYFYGCRAWNNSDDGWDQFIKKTGGFPDDITTTLEHCWAFNNGFLENGQPCSGNGNGFKLGSNEGRNNVIMNRCLAFNNLQKGFDQNHNTGNMIFNNCTGYSEKYTANKSHYTYRVDEAVASGHEVRFTNCVAISDGEPDRNKSAYAPYSIKGTTVTCDFNTLPADYKSIDPSGSDGERAEDGTLPVLDFMHIADGNTKLIDKGTEVFPYQGEVVTAEGIKYNGAAPDLGCFETTDATSIGTITSVKSDGRCVGIVQAKCGLVVLSVAGARACDAYQLVVCDAAGNTLGRKTFNGGATSISLPASCGRILVLNVAGNGVNETLKVIAD